MWNRGTWVVVQDHWDSWRSHSNGMTELQEKKRECRSSKRNWFLIDLHPKNSSERKRLFETTMPRQRFQALEWNRIPCTLACTSTFYRHLNLTPCKGDTVKGDLNPLELDLDKTNQSVNLTALVFMSTAHPITHIGREKAPHVIWGSGLHFHDT